MTEAMDRDRKADHRPKLRLISGVRPYETTIGSVHIVACGEDSPPFTVDAVALEEDTFLVLSADPEVRDPGEPLMRLMTRVIDTEPEMPGNVLVRGKSPVRLLAIVHDLDQEPTWREEWIASALRGIFREAARRRLSALALPFLGAVHGSLEGERFLELLRCALEEVSTAHPKRLWLVLPPGSGTEVLSVLGAGSKN